MLAKLAAARWLTTKQVARISFPDVSPEMARRRLRLLRHDGYIISHRINQMAEALHTLGPKSKGLLMQNGWTTQIRIERRPPKNLAHFIGINDIRAALERRGSLHETKLDFCFASWELQAQGWKFSIIPDALCQIRRGDVPSTICFEYDRGEEPPEFVARTKFEGYARGLGSLPISKVIIVVETDKRLKQLQRYAGRQANRELFLFILRGDLLSRSLAKCLS